MILSSPMAGGYVADDAPEQRANGRRDPVAPTISTHVLDTEAGQPAAGVHVSLYKLGEDDRPIRLTQALTDADGRVRDLLERPMAPGTTGSSSRSPGARRRDDATTASSAASRSTCGSRTSRARTTCRCSWRRTR